MGSIMCLSVGVGAFGFASDLAPKLLWQKRTAPGTMLIFSPASFAQVPAKPLRKLVSSRTP